MPCMHTRHAFCSLCICVYLQVLTHACICPPPPPPPHTPHPPHFITFDDFFPAEGGRICSLAVELLSSAGVAGGWVFLQNHDMLMTTSGAHVWFIMAWQTWGKTTVSDLVGIFMSSAYKADFGYYGKSSKNSWNWRYAARRLRASLVFQRSEIFLNFATQPSVLPITSPCPPAQTQPPDLLHPVPVCRGKQGESNAARATRIWGSSSRVLSWGLKMFEIWDQHCMIPRLGMWPPRAQQFILKHAFCFWPPATFFLSYFHSFLLFGLGWTYVQGSCALSPFLLFLWALFVNLKIRLREQIMKHRSAFHTLFRKNSPSGGVEHFPPVSTLTFSLCGSSFLLFYCNMKVTHSWFTLLVPFRLWFWFQFPQDEAELEHSRQTWESEYIWGSGAAALASDYKSDDVTQHAKGPKHDCKCVKSVQFFRFLHSYVSKNKSTFSPSESVQYNLPIMVTCKLTWLLKTFRFQLLLLHWLN